VEAAVKAREWFTGSIVNNSRGTRQTWKNGRVGGNGTKKAEKSKTRTTRKRQPEPDVARFGASRIRSGSRVTVSTEFDDS
jgi:hypothetical protein